MEGESTVHHRHRTQRGFSFIEILVVMGIIAVLVSLVVVVVPNIQEQARIRKSQANVSNMLQLYLGRGTGADWPRYNGKNFVLSLVATGQIDPRNPHNLETLYSPGDVLYKLDLVEVERYKDITKADLRKGTDNHDLTSYAARRNAEREHLITPDQMKMGTLVLCDDDDGPLHHPAGLVTGWSNGAARFMEWNELGILAPEDKDNPDPFLGEAASTNELRKVSSH